MINSARPIGSSADLAAILVASDNVNDATLIKNQLQEEFDRVFKSTNPDMAAQDFERHQPGVLVLAFDTLEKAERYYLGLYRQCPALSQIAHRTVILCQKDELKRVYQLCTKHHFDDYVLYWPMAYDMTRLGMAIHHALRELATRDDSVPTVAEFAAQSRRLAEREGLLDQSLTQGEQHIQGTSRALAQAEQDIGTALDVFSRRMVEGNLPDALTEKNVQALQNAVERLKREDVAALLRKVSQSSSRLDDWSNEFRRACTPHLESARALGSLAKQVRPKVLVIDDDIFEQKLVTQILGQENYHLLFASSGLEALNLLRKIRPDLILMDFQMPNMNGLETTRRLRAVPRLADVPVIMITAQSGREIVTESLKAGANGFVVKPLERETLILKVTQSLLRS